MMNKKIKNRNEIGLLIILFIIASCQEKYIRIAIANKGLASNNRLAQKIAINFDNYNGKTFLAKEIVWSNECNCGLIDVAKLHKNAYAYYPFLIDSTQVYVPQFPDTTNNNSLISTYINNNKKCFSNKDIGLIKSRISKGVIHFGGSLLNSDLDIVRDSMLLKKYLVRSDSSYKIMIE